MRLFAQRFDADYEKRLAIAREQMVNTFLYGNPHGPEHGPTPKGLFDV